METRNRMSARSIEYYVISRRWTSDLNFYKIETAFFHRLIEDHFTGLSAPENIATMKAAGKKLFSIAVEISNADKMLAGQLKQIELIAKNIIIEDDEALALTQAQLEALLNNITQQCCEIKAGLFHLVKCIMRRKNILLAS